MLEIQALTKTFSIGTANERTALRSFSLKLQKGDFVTIIGGNGAGKSTLFNLIAGSFQPDSGKILLDGEDITYLPEYRRAAYIGRLFQDPLKGTAPSLTVEENLALAYGRGAKRGLLPAITRKDRAYFTRILEPLGLGLESRMKTRMGLLSGGQRQAVTLLMATMVTPKLLLLDEHTAALDPATAGKVLALTQETVARSSITTLMVTHNIASALKLGNRTIMMDKGALALELDPAKREKMTVSEVLALFHEREGKALDNDRILLAE
ncbi:MAG: ATP-binding cassette domain-containing protein [Provencibacterium sp.]|jgi:putative ABC transport system ATP-binding protein|nr:ATP-binding cassette domain-containing protein [Provencibacterium sp.]